MSVTTAARTAPKFAVAYREEDGQPWIGLPGAVTQGKSVSEMFEAAKMGDWDVRTREVITDADTDSPDFEVIRNNPFTKGLDRLAMVKGRYTTVQNETIRDFASTLAHGDVTPVAMGQIRNGREVFMSFHLGEDIVVAGSDKIGRYMTVRSSHDGSLSLMIAIHSMRLQCQNMLSSLRSSALSTYKLRHTQSIDGRVQDAREALQIAVKQSDVFEADMNRLAEIKITKDKFWSLVEDMFPRPEKDVRGSLTKWETRTERLMSLWNGSDSLEGGNTMENLGNTAYRAYNVFNEDMRWYSTVRGGNVENALVRASGFDDASNKRDVQFYQRALSLA